LEGEPDLEIIGEASGVPDAIALTRCLQPDVVITDVFENGRGIPAIGEMRRECVGVRVVMLTGCRDQEWERAAMVAGAHAYVVNDSPIEVLLRAIRAENAELDLMARLAGMKLRDRFAGWRREQFTSESTSHVSVWERPA